jgi:ribosomal protein S18 acetylase RimI-like enzyme
MQIDGVVIRFASADDADAVAAIWHDSWHRTHAPDTHPDVVAWRGLSWFLGRSQGAVKSAYIAERARHTVAFVAWDHDKLGHLFMSHGEYGRGTADLLLTAAEEAMARTGVQQAYLYCRMTNARALRFYEKHGWSRKDEITEHLICADGTRPSKVWRMIKPMTVP